VPSLSIVLPVYNEEENLDPVVKQARSVLSEVAGHGEVIVVNDGSTDGGRDVLARLQRQYGPSLRVLTHRRNCGYGAALRAGFSTARYEFVFFTDADRQFDISELRYFLPLMADFDMAIGFRVYRYDRVLRSIVSWFYNRLVGVLFRLRVRDVDCAFKLMRREVIDQVELECNNFFISTELVARARKWNFRIVQKGVRHYPRIAGETTVHASDVPRTLRELFRMWRRIYFPRPSRLEAPAPSAAHEEMLPEPVTPES
jgi:glycosyltransferase involved in cell wall biosynthesis